MHENIEKKNNFIKIVFVSKSIYTFRNEHYLYKIDFSCSLKVFIFLETNTIFIKLIFRVR